MHNDYWVAASAAAPLIGVAQVVNLSRYLAWNTMALEGRKSAIAALADLQQMRNETRARLSLNCRSWTLRTRTR
jgi:hypothetical protein